METFLIVSAVLAGVAALFFALLYVLYLTVFYVPRKEVNDLRIFPAGEQYDKCHDEMVRLRDEAVKLPYERVFITSRDGLRLSAKYYHFYDGAPVEIMMHGYRSASIRDFSGGLIFAKEHMCNALLIDERAHGESEGHSLTFGIKERYDCLDWIEYISGRFGADTEIVLVGISMGAATVLMASGLTLPDNVKGIVADCGYTSPGEIIRKVATERKYPVKLVYPLIRLSARIYARFDPEEYGAPAAMEKCGLPVLFIHGDDDRFVPYEMSKTNYALCAGEKYFLTVHGAGHGLSYIVDNKAYSEAVGDFLNRVLDKKSDNG